MGGFKSFAEVKVIDQKRTVGKLQRPHFAKGKSKLREASEGQIDLPIYFIKNWQLGSYFAGQLHSNCEGYLVQFGLSSGPNLPVV